MAEAINENVAAVRFESLPDHKNLKGNELMALIKSDESPINVSLSMDESFLRSVFNTMLLSDFTMPANKATKFFSLCTQMAVIKFYLSTNRGNN
jgi:hypothetical protein